MIAIAAAVFCGVGMALTCIPNGSVMHMPTIKSMVLLLAVSFASAAAVDFLLGSIISYNENTACFCTAVSVFLLGVLVSSFLNPIIASDGRVAFRYPQLASILLIVFLGEVIVRKVKPKANFHVYSIDLLRPETIFLLVSVCAGLILVLSVPAETNICWDDDENYRSTLQLSEGIYTAFNNEDCFFLYGWDETKSDFKDVKDDGSLFIDANVLALSPVKVGFIGSSVGLWAGRLLGLSTDKVFTFGRIGGLFMYIAIMYFAIKRLKSLKLVLFIIALSPYAVMTAIGYSYDAWLLSFTSLGLSYFFGAVQRPNEKLSSKEICIMLSAMSIGTWPKMPYIVLILIFFLMPKEKFVDNRQRKNFYISIMAIIIIEMIYTLLATTNSGHVGDYRGGEDVNAYEQLSLIIAHPIKYLKILLIYLSSYFKPSSEIACLGHLSQGKGYGIILAAIVFYALTDNETVVKIGLLNRILTVLVCILQICVIATIFYLVFTPVGLDTVHGCQIRYKVPLYFPLTVALFSNYRKIKITNRKLYNISAYIVSTVFLICSMVISL